MRTEIPSDWVERVEETSGPYVNYLYKQELDDTFGWGERLDARLSILEDEMGLPAGLLIAGPEGCGRHTILANALQILCDDDRCFSAVFLTTEDLEDDTGSFALACQRLSALFAKYRDKNAKDRKLLLVLDEVDAYPFRSALLKFLEKMVCEYQNALKKNAPEDAPEDAQLFLVLLQKEPFPVPSILQSLLYPCRVTYPDRKHREWFFQTRGEAVYPALPKDVLLDRTEGCSYAQLLGLIKNAEIEAALLDDQISEAVLEKLIEAQKAPVTPESAKERLFEKLEQALDSLPEFLEKLGQNVGSVRMLPVQEKHPEIRKRIENLEDLKDSSAFLEKRQEEYENLCGRDLFQACLGAERNAELERTIETR